MMKIGSSMPDMSQMMQDMKAQMQKMKDFKDGKISLSKEDIQKDVQKMSKLTGREAPQEIQNLLKDFDNIAGEDGKLSVKELEASGFKLQGPPPGFDGGPPPSMGGMPFMSGTKGFDPMKQLMSMLDDGKQKGDNQQRGGEAQGTNDLDAIHQQLAQFVMQQYELLQTSDTAQGQETQP